MLNSGHSLGAFLGSRPSKALELLFHFRVMLIRTDDCLAIIFELTTCAFQYGKDIGN